MITAPEILRALNLFFAPGDVFEIRALAASVPSYRHEHIESGYFDYEHIKDVPKALENMTARGIYFTPNPVNPALLARSADRMRPAGRDETTSDKDVIRRRWLLIDCDSIRPSGISATDEEHDAALYKAIEIKDGLKSMGWPEAVFQDSGNGGQLMYLIDLPTDDNGLVKACLGAISAAGDDKVKIDLAVHNPARIWRLAGTMNRKGCEIDNRKYRMAKFLEVPEKLEIVPEEKLKALAGSAAQNSTPEAPVQTPANNSFNLDDWISKYCPDAEGPHSWKEGRKWIFPVCPFNPAHDNSSAVITQQTNGAIGFKCHHNGCINNDWHTLRKLREPEKTPVTLPDVDISGIMSGITENFEEIKPKPWHKIKNADIESVLEGTLLGEMCNVFKSVTVPELPLEAALIKSIVLAGCALSGKAESIDMNQPLYQLVRTGAPLARLYIDTADGQVPNVYALLIGNPSSGKDIGHLLNYMTKAKGWNIATRGSAEGIADALIEINNGFVTISEFQDWLNPNHWLNRGCSFLTDSFDSGTFDYALSTRGKKERRKADYCYPNLIANIQPDIFEASVRKTDISSGFLARFLFCNMPLFFGDPAELNLVSALKNLEISVNAFIRKSGKVKVPQNYLRHLSEMFKKESPEKLHPNWRRLVLSYGPRFAVMLSVTSQTAGAKEIVLDKRCWEGAEKLILWFFAHAEKALCDVEDDDPKMKAREKLYQKLFNIIKKKDDGKGVTRQAISRHGVWGTTAKERVEGLLELVERGILGLEGNVYRIIKEPPGWR